MAASWLATALRAAGLPVVEQPGWQTRGTGGSFTPVGVLCHHTAGAATGDLPSLRVVRDGRSGLPGPLSQLMLSRSGVFHVIAAGRANHAGAGTASWVPNNDGNRYLIGIEAESTGSTKIPDWTAAQRANYPRGVAALCRWMGVDQRHVLGHKEWARPVGRKIDPACWDMNDFRASVAHWLAGSGHDPRTIAPTPLPAPLLPTREDDPAMRIELSYFDDEGRPDPAGLNFRGSCPVEVGTGSVVVRAGWVRWACYWGRMDRVRVVFWPAAVENGRAPMGEADTGRYDYCQVPEGARGFTVEGRREHATTQPSFVLLTQPH